MSKGGSAGSRGSGHGRGMSAQAAARIQSAAARNPGSSSAKSGFAPRAQSAASRGEGGGQKN